MLQPKTDKRPAIAFILGLIILSISLLPINSESFIEFFMLWFNQEIVVSFLLIGLPAALTGIVVSAMLHEKRIKWGLWLGIIYLMLTLLVLYWMHDTDKKESMMFGGIFSGAFLLGLFLGRYFEEKNRVKKIIKICSVLLLLGMISFVISINKIGASISLEVIDPKVTYQVNDTLKVKITVRNQNILPVILDNCSRLGIINEQSTVQTGVACFPEDKPKINALEKLVEIRELTVKLNPEESGVALDLDDSDQFPFGINTSTDTLYFTKGENTIYAKLDDFKSEKITINVTQALIPRK